MKFVTGAIGLSTVGTMMVDGFMQMMSGLLGAPLATVRPYLRRTTQHHKSG